MRVENNLLLCKLKSFLLKCEGSPYSEELAQPRHATLVETVLGGDLSALHLGNPVAGGQRQLEVVRHDEDEGPGRGKLPQQRGRLRHMGVVEPARRFVKDQHLLAAEHGSRYGAPLLLPSRQRQGVAPPHVEEVQLT